MILTLINDPKLLFSLHSSKHPNDNDESDEDNDTNDKVDDDNNDNDNDCNDDSDDDDDDELVCIRGGRIENSWQRY